MHAQTLTICPLTQPTPFAVPLMVERFRERLSTESLGERLARMVQALEAAADATETAPAKRRPSRAAHIKAAS